MLFPRKLLFGFVCFGLLSASPHAVAGNYTENRAKSLKFVETCKSAVDSFIQACENSRNAVSKMLSSCGDRELFKSKIDEQGKQVSQYYDDADAFDSLIPGLKKNIREASNSPNGEKNLTLIRASTQQLESGGSKITQETTNLRNNLYKNPSFWTVLENMNGKSPSSDANAWVKLCLQQRDEGANAVTDTRIGIKIDIEK